METTKKAVCLGALAVEINREQLANAQAHTAEFGPAWEQAQERHSAAWTAPRGGMESATVAAVKVWLNYGDAAAAAWDGTPIGQDGYGGAYWQRWGVELRGLLSMDFGRRLDGGTLDAIILRAMEAAGCSLENL